VDVVGVVVEIASVAYTDVVAIGVPGCLER